MLKTQKRKSAAPKVLVDGVGCVLHDRCPDSGTALGGVSVIPSPRRGGMECCDVVVVGEVNQWGDHAVCSRGS
jgi:hypothetical protein